MTDQVLRQNLNLAIETLKALGNSDRGERKWVFG